MIYLLETGVCLSLLYLAYWLFLRKETYFNFNRLFLVGSLALSLAVPAFHLDIVVPRGSGLEDTASGISKIQNGYEEMIRLINADYGTEPGARHSVEGSLAESSKTNERGSVPSTAEYIQPDNRSISISKILLILYICGVVYFFARFIYLVIRLVRLANRNKVTRQDGFRMVEIKEQISPFSFFRFLFINNGSFDDSEIHQVLEHEKAHIRQKHSIDHLFAHGLAVFQWFNPFAWQIRKALKSTHEFIADRQVIDRGIERFDYQSLLLKQVIGYHSVELVNNFNLKPIKNRIAMMNKSKSGVSARLKALLVAPFAILIFFLFADFTLKGSSAARDLLKDLDGLWIKQSDDNFSETLLFGDGKFSYHDGIEINQYDVSSGKDGIVFKRPGSVWSTDYKLSGEELIFHWNPATESRYVKSKAANTLDQFLIKNNMDLDLPGLTRYRLLENENLIYRIGIGLDSNGKSLITFNGQTIFHADLTEFVNMEMGKVSIPDQRELIALFLVDQRVPMEEVDKVRMVLRNMSMYLFAEGGYPHGDLALSSLLYHSVALPRLLPPINAKVLDKKEVESRGGHVFTIDLSARHTTPGDVDQNLRLYIRKLHEDGYVISLEYDKDIPYGQYVETVDMVYNIVYSFREELAIEKYGAPYDKLGDDLQRELRKAYPMALSETMNRN